MALDVTVAICTWNRRALLESTLGNLEKLIVAPTTQWELLVVDNASTDGTAELVQQWLGRGTLPLRYVHEPVLGKSNALNTAIREARSQWLLFTDDDVIVEPDWLQEFVLASKRNPDAGAIGGRVDPWFVQEPDPVLREAFPALAQGFCGIDLGPAEYAVPKGRDLVGANFAIRIDSARRRFNPNLGPKGDNPVGGEEIAYQNELRDEGLSVVWAPRMRLKHYVDPLRMRLDYLRKFYMNVGRHEVILHGIPQGTRLAGVPRWLLGRYVSHLASRVFYALSGNTLEAHKARRQEWLTQGMLVKCRELSSRS